MKYKKGQIIRILGYLYKNDYREGAVAEIEEIRHRKTIVWRWKGEREFFHVDSDVGKATEIIQEP